MGATPSQWPNKNIQAKKTKHIVKLEYWKVKINLICHLVFIEIGPFMLEPSWFKACVFKLEVANMV